MRSEWKEIRLADVVSILGDGLHGTPKYDSDGEYYFINGNNLSNGKIVFKGDTKRVSQSEYEKYKNKLNDRTILVSINGTLGNVALYYGEKCILGKSACYFNVRDEIDKKFIKYVVSTEHFKEFITLYANGTTIKNVSLKVMRNYPFKLPQLSEQQAIAATLSCLDDKIELNNNINKNLEEMAIALFKRWFVDFEFPNENGEPYKTRGGEFEESELGLIPKGWRSGCIGDIAKHRKETLKPSDIPQGTIYVGLEHVPRRNLSIDSFGISDGLESNKTNFKKDDILFGKLRPYFHKVSIAPLDGVCSTDIIAIYATHERFYGYLIAHLFSDRLIDFVTQSSNGTKMPRTSWSEISKYPIVIPGINVADAFTAIFKRFIEQMQSNIFEKKGLSQLRDTLLPKLMSGEIRVPIEREYTQIADLRMVAESSEKYNSNP